MDEIVILLLMTCILIFVIIIFPHLGFNKQDAYNTIPVQKISVSDNTLLNYSKQIKQSDIPNKNIPKNIQINTNNNIIKISSNNDVSINNMELFTLLLEQKNNNNKNNKQTIITKSTKNISLKTKNYIKMLLIQKNDNIDIDIDI